MVSLWLDARVSSALARGIGMRLLMCRNCKHWEVEVGGHQWRANDENGTWGYCGKTGSAPGWLAGPKEALMIAEVDGGDYPNSYPTIQTRHDFGCVMFEAKGAE